MATFIPNQAGLAALLQQIGEQQGARYSEVDAEIRRTCAGQPASEILGALRARLTDENLAEVSDMEAWANAIAVGETFQLRIHVS